jgi:hypothetical protein
MANQAWLQIFLRVFPSAMDFYTRFGLKYVSQFDTDLSECRGYGVFRFSAEVREVGGGVWKVARHLKGVWERDNER